VRSRSSSSKQQQEEEVEKETEAEDEEGLDCRRIDIKTGKIAIHNRTHWCNQRPGRI